MRYFEKRSEEITSNFKKVKISPSVKGVIAGLGILGTGYAIHSLTKKPTRVWDTKNNVYN